DGGQRGQGEEWCLHALVLIVPREHVGWRQDGQNHSTDDGRAVSRRPDFSTKVRRLGIAGASIAPLPSQRPIVTGRFSLGGWFDKTVKFA
ncbi:MAG: hypothetical protein WCP53_06365, partial [Verrucomicrobiota bacterium]